LPANNDFFLRVDMLPNRLYRFDADSNGWIAVEDAVRMNMTNNDTRNTQKTGFINNVEYTYNNELASDFVNLAKDATVVNTTIDYANFHLTPYVVISLSTEKLSFALADYPNLFVSYSYTSPTGVMSNKIRIQLPTVPDVNNNPVQQTIPFAGQWTIKLYNSREEQRQSLSQVLRPKADL